jgi:hypothetical protein
MQESSTLAIAYPRARMPAIQWMMAAVLIEMPEELAAPHKVVADRAQTQRERLHILRAPAGALARKTGLPVQRTEPGWPGRRLKGE